MDTTPTKQLPGERVQLDQQLMDELRILDPKRFYKQVAFFGGHPFSLVKKDENKIFTTKTGHSPYLICQKTDGVRYMLLITNTDHYFISREGKSNLVVYKSECQVANNWHMNPWGQFRNIIHILDGQMINDKELGGGEKLRYLIFDALVVFGKKIIEQPLKKRLEQCEKFINCNQYLLEQVDKSTYRHAIEVKLKDFFRLSCYSYLSSQSAARKNLAQPTTMQYLNEYYVKALPHENDGIIINDEDKPYLLGRNQGYLKWKPAQLNTVDFLVVPNTKLQGRFEKRVLDLYLGWKDEEITNIYRMIFHNFTIVSQAEFQDLQKRQDEKYNAALNENPDMTEIQDSFGIIAQCKYNKVEPGKEQANMFKQLFSSTKSVEQIHACIMKQRNEKKELEVIKKIQNQPYTKYWKILRIRRDKNMPNDHEVVFKIEESIKDDIKYEDLVVKNKQLIDSINVP